MQELSSIELASVNGAGMLQDVTTWAGKQIGEYLGNTGGAILLGSAGSVAGFFVPFVGSGVIGTAAASIGSGIGGFIGREAGNVIGYNLGGFVEGVADGFFHHVA